MIRPYSKPIVSDFLRLIRSLKSKRNSIILRSWALYTLAHKGRSFHLLISSQKKNHVQRLSNSDIISLPYPVASYKQDMGKSTFTCTVHHKRNLNNEIYPLGQITQKN